ncbi:MAG: FAD-dependent oxidoreductase [Clostridia bacterium]|nr:FAD-dependent oxidoreductase [Clostridia bacterium]
MNKINYQKEINVSASVDVLVVGGGPSGFAAAIGCAVAQSELGGSVMLIESSGTFGGASTLAGVPELMNFDDGNNFLAKGVGERVYDMLFDERTYRREWKLVRAERLKRVYDTLALEAGVDFRFYTKLVDVEMSENRVEYAIISSPEGLSAIKCSAIVDCTGSGAVAALAGAQYEYGDEGGNTMPATLCSLWGGIDFSRKGRDADHYERAYADGVFSKYDACLPGIKPNYAEIGVGAANAGHAFSVDDRDSKSLTDAMIESRAALDEYIKFYREYVPGGERAELIDSANFLGIRESRRILCEQTLTADSFFDQSAKPDEIGRYSYPVDIHPMTPDRDGMRDFDKAVAIKHKDGESYSIPYGALVVRGIDNMLVAGRCIGADRSMQASVRVIPACYITGQAAGVAAAISAHDSVAARDVDVKKLREFIEKI